MLNATIFFRINFFDQADSFQYQRRFYSKIKITLAISRITMRIPNERTGSFWEVVQSQGIVIYLKKLKTL